LALIFANVGDDPVRARLQFDARPYGFDGSAIQLVKITPAGSGETVASAPLIDRDELFPPRTVWAWEIDAVDVGIFHR
jgi:hypothetical protein